MKRHLFFRLEQATNPKKGVYSTFSPIELFGLSYNFMVPESMGHPGPTTDKRMSPVWDRLGSNAMNYYFGFCSLVKLRLWFNRDAIINLINLSDAFPFKRIVLQVYEVRYSGDIIKGSKQSAVYLRVAKRLATFDLDFLLQPGWMRLIKQSLRK